MSKLRSVNTHFWSDNYIIELDPVDKLIFLYLLTNEHTNMLGAYELHISKVAFDTGNPLPRVRKAFEDFEKDGKIAYVGGYIILKNFLKHQNLNVNMQKSAINSFNEIPPDVKQHPFLKHLTKALKGFIKGSQSLKEYELELEYELEYEIETEEENTHTSARASAGDAEMILNAYPRKVAPAKGLAEIKKSLKRLEKNPEIQNPAEWLLKKTMTFAESPAGNQGRYTPYPATWFEEQRYLDDPDEWQKNGEQKQTLFTYREMRGLVEKGKYKEEDFKIRKDKKDSAGNPKRELIAVEA